ncbi:MAG: hypothetical protein WA629_01675 [Candidatus Aquilonibacter sp.]
MNDHASVDRFVDFASLVLISVAAVLTALCGYQSGRWDGEQTRLYNVASADRVLSEEANDQSIGLTVIDVAAFLDYINAVEAGDTRKEQFIYQRLPPRFRLAMDAWLATKPLTNPKAPSSPFVMREFLKTLKSGSDRYDALAAVSFNAALTAHEHADGYLLLTVIFAAVSFLAGMSTKMIFPRHAIVVALGIVALAYGVFRLIGLPVI